MPTETAMPTLYTSINTAQQYRDRYRPTVPDMIDDTYAGGSLLCAISGTNITVALGGAIVQGARYDLTTTPLTLAALAAGAANIFQIVCLTYDISHTPPVYARILGGTSGGAISTVPLNGSLTGVWDFPLAHFERQPAGTLVNLRDRRKFTDGTGDTIAADDATGPGGVGWYPPFPRVGQQQRFWPSGDVWLWTGTVWSLVSRGVTPVCVQALDATSITSIITTYATGTPVVSASMVAPASGGMYVTVEDRGHHPTVGQAALVSFEVRLTNNAGAIQLAASDSRACQHISASDTTESYRHYVSGLTPGSTYYVQVMIRSSDTTAAQFKIRQLLLEPAK
jgi:hypothetical protein